jgi:hypothetical protein
MDAKDIRNLSEAYISVYQPQYISEEVEIATEYFYEMGLNEYGIDILIEELGEDEFVDWVDEIVEESYLEEASQTRLQKMADKKNKILVGPKGSRPQSTTKAAIKKYGGTVRGGISGGVSGVIKKREGAVASAQAKQPASSSTPTQTRMGIAGRLGAALGGAVKKAKQDIELTKKTAQTVGKAVKTGIDALNTASDSRLARQARVATHKGVKRHTQVLTAAGGALGRTLGASTARRRALSKEEYDYILSHLLDEGYAETVEGAEVILMNMSEEWCGEVLDEGFKRMNRGKIERQAKRLGGDRGDVLRIVADKLDTPIERKYSTSQARKNRSKSGEYRQNQHKQAAADARADFEKYGM